LSRIFAGQHFRFDEVSGEQLGRDVADFVVDHFLTPLHGQGDGGSSGPGDTAMSDSSSPKYCFVASRLGMIAFRKTVWSSSTKGTRKT
jgi:hypothetical protein